MDLKQNKIQTPACVAIQAIGWTVSNLGWQTNPEHRWNNREIGTGGNCLQAKYRVEYRVESIMNNILKLWIT